MNSVRAVDRYRMLCACRGDAVCCVGGGMGCMAGGMPWVVMHLVGDRGRGRGIWVLVRCRSRGCESLSHCGRSERSDSSRGLNRRRWARDPAGELLRPLVRLLRRICGRAGGGTGTRESREWGGMQTPEKLRCVAQCVDQDSAGLGWRWAHTKRRDICS